MKQKLAELCVLAPPEGMAGVVVLRWSAAVVAASAVPWVALTDVDVSGESRARLLVDARECRVVSSQWFFGEIARANQVVWCSAFFCAAREQAAAIAPSESYAVSVLKADVTVRVVDATYFYAFGSPGYADSWRRLFPASRVRVVFDDELEFPE